MSSPGEGPLAPPDKNPLTLRFRDRGLERSFLDDHALSSLPFVRVGLVVSLLLWPLGALLLPGAGVGDATVATQTIFFGVVPTMSLLLVLSRWAPASWIQQGLSMLGNLCSGLFMILVAEQVGAANDVLVIALMMSMVFAFSMMRLFLWSAIGATAPILATYFGLALARGTFAPLQGFLLAGSWFSAVVALYLNERTARDAYYQRRVVTEQRALLAGEREKSERLLLNILPASIALQLKEGNATIAEHFSEATVLFADIVGFTPFSAGRAPAEVLRLLDVLFTGFDQLAEKHGLEKIKTIGDAYMAVSGVPLRRSDHAQAAAAMALEMIAFTSKLAAAEQVELGVRVGVHSGPLIAGVIGKKKFMYDLWGDTVNTASRMESHGLAGKVHVTEATWKLLEGQFVGEDRGEVEVKGKGPMHTVFISALR